MRGKGGNSFLAVKWFFLCLGYVYLATAFLVVQDFLPFWSAYRADKRHHETIKSCFDKTPSAMSSLPRPFFGTLSLLLLVSDKIFCMEF
jgi:hypothetical protein